MAPSPLPSLLCLPDLCGLRVPRGLQRADGLTWRKEGAPEGREGPGGQRERSQGVEGLVQRADGAPGGMRGTSQDCPEGLGNQALEGRGLGMGPQVVPRAEWVGEHQAVSCSSNPMGAASSLLALFFSPLCLMLKGPPWAEGALKGGRFPGGGRCPTVKRVWLRRWRGLQRSGEAPEGKGPGLGPQGSP